MTRNRVDPPRTGHIGLAGRGRLVPLGQTVEEGMGESVDAAKGLLFDGFPRTIPQAEAMKTSDVDLDVVEIYVPDATIFERMSGHRVHMASGTISRRSVPLCREALVPLNLPNRASAMKVYIITSGLVFGLLLPAHVACLLQEGVQVAQDPWFTIANGCGSRICDLGMAPAQTARRSLNGPSIKREGGIV